MQYVGGKSRMSKYIAKAILDNTTNRNLYVEPFIGGGASFAAGAPYFDQAWGCDAHEDLILLWQAIAAGWIPPTNVSEEEYQRLRKETPSALRGFVGFACSFGAKWFGGFARNATNTNYADQGSRSIVKKLSNVDNVTFIHGSYEELLIPPGAVVYCDPPYAGTQGYGGIDKWKAKKFWTTAEEWSKVADVFVSEYKAPEGWKCILEREHIRQLQGLKLDKPKTMEKLFKFDN